MNIIFCLFVFVDLSIFSVFSFVSLSKELLQLPNVKYLLSDKFNQDSLEEHFSKVRGAGGHWDNPTVERYGDLSMNILVGGECVRGSLKANVKRQQGSGEADATLPKPKKPNNSS